MKLALNGLKKSFHLMVIIIDNELTIGSTLRAFRWILVEKRKTVLGAVVLVLA